MPFENLLNISVKKDWVDYLSALLMPIGMMYIAYMQWLTEEARRRHELLDKRSGTSSLMLLRNLYFH
jgi:hypothetical protein